MANIKQRPTNADFFLPLDNSAVFIASTTRKAAPYVFRVSCELNEAVYLPDLELALAEVAERFPFLKTELRPGLFWYYLDPLKKPLLLQADTRYPGEYHRLYRWGRYLFRVRVYGPRVSCEFHHILTDGTGAMEFLRSLIAAYLTRRGVACPDWEGIRHPTSAVDPAELEDSYANVARENIPLPDRLPEAFKLPGLRYADLTYRVTTGTLPLDACLAVAKDHSVSLTVLLASVYLAALQDVCESGSPAKYRPLCIQVPVNMRKFHPSRTLRNFFLFFPVSIDRRLGHYEFSEIVERVQYTFKLSLTVKELDRQIRRNVRGERYLFSRLVPLVIKNVALRLIGRLAADRPFSGNLSNLQSVSMPQAFAAHIRRFDLLPSRKSVLGANVGVVSWLGYLSITVGSVIVDRAFERAFFTRCAALGMPVTVESNV